MRMKIENKYNFKEFLKTEGNEIIHRPNAIYMVERINDKTVLPHLLTTKKRVKKALDEDFNFLSEHFASKGYSVVLAWVKLAEKDFMEELQRRKYIVLTKTNTHFLLGRVLTW